MPEYSVIGKPMPRVDARAKVTGQAKYAADYSLPGMLWCKLLRSPHPHARILGIDTSRAERLPGVKVIVTGKDFGGWTWGWMASTRDEPPLAVDSTPRTYQGHRFVRFTAASSQTSTASESPQQLGIPER